MTTLPLPPFPYDSQMRELPAALDTATVAPLLGAHVFARRGEPVRVECRVVRIRYRPGARCLLQYAAAVQNTSAGQSGRHFVTGMLFGDSNRAARLARHMPGTTFIPELRMLARVFPSDRKLPWAPTLMSADDPELRAAVLHCFGGGSWTIDRWATEVVRYREELSLVVRYTVSARRVATGEVQERVFYAKAYPNPDAARRMSTHIEQLARYSTTFDAGVRIGRPIASLDHLSTLLLLSTAGRPLSDIIATASHEEATEAVALSARGLARFHLSDAPTVRRYSTDEYVHSLARPRGILEWAFPELASPLHRICHAARELPEAELRPTHRDMKPEHVLIGPNGPALIDLDSCAAADPVLDSALMLARFAVLGLDNAQRARAQLFAACFAQEYFCHVPTAWRARLPTYFAASLMEVAAGLFHRQDNGWRQTVPTLIEAATRALLARPDTSADASSGLVDAI